MAKKVAAFQASKVLVDPIVEQHGLAEYRIGPVFQTTQVYTPAEQHLSLATTLADWLLED